MDRDTLKECARKEYASGNSTRAVSEQFGVSAATVWRWCKDIMRHNSEIDRSGSNNGRYKGGHIDDRGYRVIWVDGRLTGEHRHLMEEHIGRKLDVDEVVHHINGNKLDNRIENLMVLSRADHQREHAEPWERKICPICRKPFDKPPSTSPGVWEKRITCSNECSHKLLSLKIRGEKNSKSKLTPEDVLEIRRCGLSLNKLAKKYNVSKTTIRHILIRKIWKHI